MANAKQLNNKKAGLLKQKASIEALQKTYAEKLVKIDGEIAEVDTQLEAEVGELQKMIDEIRNGATPVVVETEKELEFN